MGILMYNYKRENLKDDKKEDIASNVIMEA